VKGRRVDMRTADLKVPDKIASVNRQVHNHNDPSANRQVHNHNDPSVNRQVHNRNDRDKPLSL
jgi:hypothetical protein